MVFLTRLCAITLVMLAAGCQNLTELYFYPDTHYRLTPDQLGLDYKALDFTAEDGTALSAWWVPAQAQKEDTSKEQPRGSILFLHGNAENISTHIHNIAWLARQGYNLLLLDYRGYGRSQGVPRLPEVLLDIDAAAVQLEQLSEPPYYLLGQSLGASLAAYWLPSRLQSPCFNGLILDAPFASYPGIARHALAQGWLSWPLQPSTYLVPSRWDPLKSISQLQTPLLLFHSPDDSIIPTTQAELLFAAAPEPKQWQSTQGPHTATFGMSENRELLLEFLAQQQDQCRPDE